MPPTVTVCVPTYNGAPHLAPCLESARAQTFEDLEILIVDDASRDETVAVARTYAAQDSRIRILVNPQNLGLVGNWNQAARLATGAWIKFLFQDD